MIASEESRISRKRAWVSAFENKMPIFGYKCFFRNNQGLVEAISSNVNVM